MTPQVIALLSALPEIAGKAVLGQVPRANGLQRSRPTCFALRW
jgi:hypothetical protein